MALFIALVLIVVLVEALSNLKRLEKVFNLLPTIFWIYFVPMVFATFGFFPEKSPVFGFIRDYFLPASLFLLFISVSIPELLKLGRRTLVVMLAASGAIIVGAAGAAFVLIPLFKGGFLPESHLDFVWKGVAALSGSWTGGSANMAAIWESVTGPEKSEAERQVYSAMIAVDVCVGYSWMAFLVGLAGYQKKINLWLQADNSRIDEVNRRMQARVEGEKRQASSAMFLAIMGVSLSVAFCCLKAGGFLNANLASGIQSPLWRSVFSPFAITIVLVTCVGLACSSSRVARLEIYGASKIGYALLYIVLARIGAEGNLSVIREFPAYLAMGVVWILLHGAILFGVLKFLKAPLFFGVTASQANVGGPVSAPVVAAAHQPNLAVVGLLMAILGNIVGTFIGLFLVGPMVHWILQKWGH